jgi:catechol 2,3-dioxygenase-like lactoylglutathione lyase family enzyme
MSVQLNHTIVWCRDKYKSAAFLTEILGLPSPTPFGPMLVVALDNSVSLDYYEKDGKIALQHYAFLIGEDEFDQVFARIGGKGLQHWADPGKHRVGDIDQSDGGRRMYFDDPDGHLLEVMTRPYGSGG